MKSEEAKRLKALGGGEPATEDAGERPRARHPEARAVLGERLVSRSQKRAAVTEFHSKSGLSERGACNAIAQARDSKHQREAAIRRGTKGEADGRVAALATEVTVSEDRRAARPQRIEGFLESAWAWRSSKAFTLPGHSRQPEKTTPTIGGSTHLEFSDSG